MSGESLQASRHPVCKGCSEVCSKCSVQWLCTECLPMDEHNCTYLLMQTSHDQARLAEANTQRDFLASEAQLAEKGPSGSRGDDCNHGRSSSGARG
eukprot:5861306-Pyramimonas_sp.AAC.1